MQNRREAAHDLSVTVASGGDRQRLGAMLASVRESAGWLDLETTVVDIRDGRVADYVEERFPGTRTVRCPNRGLAHAYNLALEQVDARYVLFAGPELETCEGNLAALVAELDRRPEVALAGVLQLDEDGALWPTMRRFPSARHMLAEAIGADRLPGMKRFLGEYELDDRRYAHTAACEWTSGLQVVRCAALEGTGWFDERLRGFAAEADLCMRLRRDGWEVLHVPTVTARRRRRSLREQPRLEAQAAYARMQFARKHFPRASADYRWALALRYGLRVGVHSLRRGAGARRQASRTALSTVLRGQPPVERASAA
jgi:N-acetylglucosaminyl-diphospho-decaprenol L-rhamnosyltransferase